MDRKRFHIGGMLFSYLLSGGLWGPGTLCICGDGHVEIEPANVRCCKVETCPAENDDHPCGTCTDIPLLDEHVQPKGPHLKLAMPMSGYAPLVSSLAVLSIPATLLKCVSVIERVDPGGIPCAHLHSVILLC